MPFGGGTSVVGGVEPLRGSHSRLVSLDLGSPARRRGRPPLADRAARRRPARAGGGSRPQRRGRRPRPLPAVLRVRDDRRLRRDPLCRPGLERLRPLRRAGQRRAADRPGRASCARWRRPTRPPGRRCASSSSARRASFGVIPEVTVRVRPQPRQRRYEAWIAESFEAGAEIVRALAQGPGLPDVIRVSDEEETEGSLALSGPRGARRERLRRLPGAAPQARRLPDRRRPGGGRGVGRPPPRPRGSRPAPRRRRLPRPGRPGRSWEHGRFQGPYLRDTLMEHGGDGRDAGDLAHLVAAGRAARGRRRRDPRLARRPGHAGARLLPPLARLRRRRLALLHLHLPRPQRRGDRAVASREARRLGGDRRQRAARSPTTTPSAATMPPTWRPRWGRPGSRCCGRSRSGSIPPGS